MTNKAARAATASALAVGMVLGGGLLRDHAESSDGLHSARERGGDVAPRLVRAGVDDTGWG
ncbi:hypothetical protein [Streptomyces chumphonensis]|uniref:hypothetical protein n=1 Tax=Streptomyces chumphonensis TaxID=1214925 RepID=UPI003D76253F